MPTEKLDELKNYCSEFGADLKPISVDASLFDNAPTNKRYPKEMYYRLLSPLILPKELDRILYLDTEHEYFNSGVLLIDLNTARKLVTSNDIFDCVRQHKKVSSTLQLPCPSFLRGGFLFLSFSFIIEL